VVCDPSVLKHGVRRIYALDGSLVTNLDQLDEGQAYVCASTEQFHRLDYINITRVDWVNPSRKISTPAIVKPSESYLAQFQRPHQPTRRYGIKQRSRVCLSVCLSVCLFLPPSSNRARATWLSSSVRISPSTTIRLCRLNPSDAHGSIPFVRLLLN